MIAYAVYDEVNGDTQQPLFLVTEEDIELKKLLWTQIFSVCRDPFNTAAHDIIIQKNFIRALLMYLDAQSISQSQLIARWTGP